MTTGAGYLIDAVAQLDDLPRKAEYVGLLRELLVDQADQAQPLSPEEETAIGVVLGAMQLAIAQDDYEGLLRTVAAGMQVGIRFAGR
jgi:hypothetical protein